MKKTLSLTMLILLHILIWGVYKLPAQGVKFRHYSVKDGISQSEIKNIFQDSEGYIWFGTQNGLNKFDGYTFEKYFFDPTDTTSISNAWIFSITEDTKGDIWIATKEGVNIFNKATRTFTRVPHRVPNGAVNDNFAYGITCDDSLVYVNTPPVLSVISIKTHKLTTYKNNFDHDGALHDIGFPILKDSQGLIWIGSGRGLYYFNPKDKTFTNFKNSPTNPNSLSNNHVTALFEDRDGTILVGTENGLNRFHKTENIFTHYFHDPYRDNTLSNNFIRSITQDYMGSLWIGTEGGGLNKMRRVPDSSIVIFSHFNSGTDNINYISHDIIHSLYEDRSHNLWIGTSAGIDKLDLKRKNFKWYRKSDHPDSVDLLDNIIASIYEDEYGMLWIGTWGKGLNIFDPITNKVTHYSSLFKGDQHIPNNHVHVIFKDSKSRIWLGTRNGVSIYNPQDKSFIPVQKYFKAPHFDLFHNNRVYCIIEDSQGRIWIGTGRGIVILNTQNKQAKSIKAGDSHSNNIGSNLVYSLLEDNDNHIWIATSHGLDRYIPSQDRILHYLNDPESTNTLCDNYVISLCQDKRGDIWIGTSSGVNRFNKKDSLFTHYSIQNGLPSNIVYDIIKDENQNLWFSTGDGLAMYNIDTHELITYAIEDELRGMEFNIKAAYKARRGFLFFGGIEGLISFHPDSLKPNSYIPPIVITSIIKENDGIKQRINTYTSEIILKYHDYSFDIEFSALDYTNPLRNKYCYRMKGLSDKWIDVGNRHFVPFTNLPPGHYTFTVKGTNNDGIWNQNGTQIKITILPPWWKSKYAYVGYLISIILLIILIIKRRERKLIHEKEILEQKVRLRTKEIALQKGKVEESEEKLRSTITSIDDLVFVLDQKGIFQEYYNPSKRDTLYLHPELYMHKHFTEVGLPQRVVEQLKKVFKQQQSFPIFHEFDYSLDKDGNKYWFNAKVSPRRNAMGYLSGITIVARDITARKRAEKQLQKQKNALKDLNATKDKFYSILAHDLKNPFTSLFSLSELISTNYKDLEDEDKIMILERIHKSAQLIFNLLENLLTWSRSQRGKIEYMPHLFNLSQIIDQNINLHQVAAVKKGVILSANIKEGLLAFGDREMTNTVIRNLINNAVKFTPMGGTIYVDIDEKDQMWEVRVKDQGIGISPDNIEKLFRIDVKFKSEGTDGEKGTGLGLVLCKEFVEKNRGTIWCESQKNVGSVFHFTIPKTNISHTKKTDNTDLS